MSYFFSYLATLLLGISIELLREMIAEYGPSIIKWLVKQMFGWF